MFRLGILIGMLLFTAYMGGSFAMMLATTLSYVTILLILDWLIPSKYNWINKGE